MLLRLFGCGGRVVGGGGRLIRFGLDWIGLDWIAEKERAREMAGTSGSIYMTL
jgi:hypothetical protein